MGKRSGGPLASVEISAILTEGVVVEDDRKNDTPHHFLTGKTVRQNCHANTHTDTHTHMH